jgi:hypothetical protein
MHAQRWCWALGLSLLAAGPASAEVIKGVLSVKGAQMS